MAIEAGRAKRQRVRGHESQVHLTVTGIAGVWGERCDIAVMAISACERCTRSRKLVSVQGESHRLVGEGRIVHHR